MSDTMDVIVPDLGDFSDVEVIEVLVSPGDEVQVEDSVIVLETDKASMDIPATHAGKVSAVHVAVGDKVSAGDAILTIETADPGEIDKTQVMSTAEVLAVAAASSEAPHAAPDLKAPSTHEADQGGLGSGPGGYNAACRAADGGLDGTVNER